MSRVSSKAALVGATLVAGGLFYAHEIEPSNVEVKAVSLGVVLAKMSQGAN